MIWLIGETPRWLWADKQRVSVSSCHNRSNILGTTPIGCALGRSKPLLSFRDRLCPENVSLYVKSLKQREQKIKYKKRGQS